MSSPIEFITLDWDGRPVRLEYRWYGVRDASAPVMVFLHEGLGSLAMWKDFPEALCRVTGFRGLVYSRPGYGRSTPRPADERWNTDFMHRQACGLLPAFLEALQIDTLVNPPWLFGHSDGGSIALIFAARLPAHAAGVVVLSPHIMVEDLTLESIERARSTYLGTDLKRRLARYHADVDSAFWGWNDIWLRPPFRDWSIEDELENINCPLLAVQGVGDEYGTLEQVRGIARRVAQAEIAELAACGHSPHRDQPRKLIELTARFLQRVAVQPGADETGFYAHY